MIRSEGKALYYKQLLELALAAGKTVAVVKPEGTCLYKQRRGLLVITPIKPKPSEATIIIDDLRCIDDL